MTPSIQQQYESLPYPHFVHPLADTARLAAVGRVLGLNAADPATARVLDIGCGSGTHLLALAARSPGGRFVGIDFSAPDIAQAQALAAEAGLSNIEFRHVDLMAWQPDGEPFDVVIAYGFFSWVPDAVKDRLLHVAAASLAPQGIACISYLTYPGCKQAEALRDLLRLHTDALAEPAAKVAAAHATLDMLDTAWQATPSLPHAAHLRDEARRIREKAAHSLLLDDLGVERDPCYLMQFVQWAAEHGLRYLGDSDYATMLPGNLPPAAAQALAALRLDRLGTEQMLDYVGNRSFRCSLLVGPAAEVSSPRADALRALCLSSALRPAGTQRSGAAEGRFVAEGVDKLILRSVPLVAFAQALAARAPGCTPYAALRDDAQRRAGRAFTADEEAQLCADLLQLYGRRQIALAALPWQPAERLPAQPRLSPLNAALARQRGLLVTPGFDTVRLDATEQALCPLLDGTRTLPALRATPAGQALGARLEPLLQALWRKGCTAG